MKQHSHNFNSFNKISVLVSGDFQSVSDFIMGVYCVEFSELEWVMSSLEHRGAGNSSRNFLFNSLLWPQCSLYIHKFYTGL